MKPRTLAIRPTEPEPAKRLRLAREYWLKSIHPHIKDRLLGDIEFYVASDAYSRLKAAQREAQDWNDREKGRTQPIPPDLFVDFSKPAFREPEELLADDHVKPELLATIAASLSNCGPESPTPTEAVRRAHVLLVAAIRYVESLPKPRGGTASALHAFDTALGHSVTFPEIAASNKKGSGCLPLLPPEGQKRKSIPDEEQQTEPKQGQGKDGGWHGAQRTEPLSIPAIRNAVIDYLQENRPRLTQEDYERGQQEDERLTKKGTLRPWGSGKSKTYQEWQDATQEAIDDCRKNGRISVQNLCSLRWQRFERRWSQRQLIAANRKPARRKGRNKQHKTPPSSAASSPTRAGKQEK